MYPALFPLRFNPTQASLIGQLIGRKLIICTLKQKIIKLQKKIVKCFLLPFCFYGTTNKNGFILFSSEFIKDKFILSVEKNIWIYLFSLKCLLLEKIILKIIGSRSKKEKMVLFIIRIRKGSIIILFANKKRSITIL